MLFQRRLSHNASLLVEGWDIRDLYNEQAIEKFYILLNSYTKYAIVNFKIKGEGCRTISSLQWECFKMCIIRSYHRPENKLTPFQMERGYKPLKLIL